MEQIGRPVSFVRKDVVVFLDRDGTLTQEKGLINHESRLELENGAASAVASLNAAHVAVVVVTNQPGVGKGFISAELLQRTHRRLEQLLAEHNAHLNGIYTCSHGPTAAGVWDCECHKPSEGLVVKALEELGWVPKRIYVVGDRASDVELSRNLGAQAILVLTGYGKGEWEYRRDRFVQRPTFVASNLPAAVNWILEREMLPDQAGANIDENTTTTHMVSHDREQPRILQSRLEKHAAQLLGHTFAVAVNAGTSALHSAYFAAGIGPGDEVIVPAYGFFATVTPLLQLGAIPVFVDVTETGAPDIDEVACNVTVKTKAIVLSHFWGVPYAVDAIHTLARRRGMRVIEDCCQAFACVRYGTIAGSRADLAVTSFNSFKAISAGEGGLVATSDSELLRRVVLLGQGGSYAQRWLSADDSEWEIAKSGLGFKYRIHPAAVVQALESLDSLVELKRSRAAWAHAILDALSAFRDVRSFVSREDLPNLLLLALPLLFPDSACAERARVMWAGSTLMINPGKALGAFCRYKVLREPTSYFPHLPDNWGCKEASCPGALALERRLIQLLPSTCPPNSRVVAMLLNALEAK